MSIDLGKVLDLLKGNLGKPYQFGANGPNAFDCSGLVQYVYSHVGVSLPHRSEDQAKMGTPVDPKDIRAGDLVFTNWGDGPNSHVGIATGPNQIIDAPHTGAVVRYDNLNASYRSHITAVRRFGDPVPGPGDFGGPNLGDLVGGAGADAAGSALSLALPDGVLQFFTDANKAVTGALWWFNPSHIVRVFSGLAGGVCILLGLLFLSREVR